MRRHAVAPPETPKTSSEPPKKKTKTIFTKTKTKTTPTTRAQQQQQQQVGRFLPNGVATEDDACLRSTGSAVDGGRDRDAMFPPPAPSEAHPKGHPKGVNASEDEDASGGSLKGAAALFFPSLPDDVLARVFRTVANPKDLAALTCVCRDWRRAVPMSGAWRMLCDESGRAPRRPRKPWMDLYLDEQRRRRAQLENDHELLMLRVTMDPRRGKGNEDVGAMRRDRPRRLRRLLHALGPGLDVNHRSVTYSGRTLLHVAARLGSVGCARELLTTPWRADPNVSDVEGWTPLMEAAFRGNEAMAIELLAHGARDDAFVGSRDMGKGRIMGPLSASEWADTRGNHRLKRMITGEESAGRATGSHPLIRVNATPFSI